MSRLYDKLKQAERTRLKSQPGKPAASPAKAEPMFARDPTPEHQAHEDTHTAHEDTHTAQQSGAAVENRGEGAAEAGQSRSRAIEQLQAMEAEFEARREARLQVEQENELLRQEFSSEATTPRSPIRWRSSPTAKRLGFAAALAAAFALGAVLRVFERGDISGTAATRATASKASVASGAREQDTLYLKIDANWAGLAPKPRHQEKK